MNEPETTSTDAPEPVADQPVAEQPAAEQSVAEPSGPESGTAQFRATARRAPKVGVFLTLGGLLGAIVAVILTAAHGASAAQPADAAGADNGVWIFVVFVFAIAIGVALGGLVVLILDRASRRRAVLVTVERGMVEAAADGADEAAVADEAMNEEPAQP